MKGRLWFFIISGLLVMGIAVMPAFAQNKLSGEDMKFLKKAASGGMMEVQLGQIAQEKGQAQEVKDFGSRMVTDHGKANDELKALAQQKGVKVPEKMEKKHQSMVDKMKKASGADFDKKYMKEMVKDHTKDVEEFKKASEKVKDQELKDWAAKTLPVLEQHLQLAKETGKKVGADVEKTGKQKSEKKQMKQQEQRTGHEEGTGMK